MTARTALVITSIFKPNAAIEAFAAGCRERGVDFIVVGDVQTPADFNVDGCSYYSVENQRETALEFAVACPTRHYARKNIGYLIAMQRGAERIVESDDDNVPRPSFWDERQRRQTVARTRDAGWTNVYAHFSDHLIWPRGLPLDAVHAPLTRYDELAASDVDCPVQQGLADENPDVDAIYRLLLPLPIRFRDDRRVAYGAGSWSPFNSQNTTWWADAFPLMYLPVHCTMRATDIWRSLIAQRVAWTNGWCVLFDGPSVYQERNEHNLMRDFQDEVPVYLRNREIARILDETELHHGVEHIPDNMIRCYEALANASIMSADEIPLLQKWLNDVARLRPGRR